MKIRQALILLVLAALLIGGSAIATAETAESASPDVLVTADWLEENLDAENIRIIEVSVNPGVYERGHIPGDRKSVV